MPKPRINLYAEILTHIRQLTLHASLETDKNEHTKVLISSDKKVITVLHEGESTGIYLPTQISGTANVTFPTERKTDFSTRLQIDDTENLNCSSDESGGVEAPWSAAELTEKTAISCKACHTEVLAAESVRIWKDLPSEHWADLMDFWFCHKPHQGPSENEHAAESKGFSARSKLVAISETGLVDTVSVLLHQEDCKNVEIIPDSLKPGFARLCCAKCSRNLGSSSEAAHGLRLRKSQISVQLHPEAEVQDYPATVFVCCELLMLIESTSSRRIVVHTNAQENVDADNSAVLLWVFNPNIFYSSSKRGPTAHRAMKVFYKTVQAPVKLLEDNSNTHEELLVIEDEYTNLLDTLAGSTAIIPESGRKFQDWNVGLLDRWEKHATGSAQMDQNPLNKRVDEGFETFKLPAGWQELYL